MKKLLLTLFVSIALGGLVFAQEGFEWHWPQPANGSSGQCGLCAAIAIDGHVFTVEDEGWNQLEFAAFTGDVIRARDILTRKYVDQYGDPYPITDFTAVQYDDPGVAVSFKLYNHVNGVEYDICEITYLGEPMTILTGQEHTEAMEFEPYLPIILNFTSPAQSLDLDVESYTEDGGYYLIAPPFGQVNPSDVTNMIPAEGDFDLYYFDQTQDLEWINIKDGNTALQSGKGYLYAREQGATLTFTGTPLSEDSYDVTLEYDETCQAGTSSVTRLPPKPHSTRLITD